MSIPVGYIGEVRSLADMERLLGESFAFVQVGRSTIRDPGFGARLERGEITESDCDSCNRCIASMNVPGGTCALTES